MTQLILILVGLFVLVAVFSIIDALVKSKKEPVDVGVYEKKPFLFDSTSEFKLYKKLLEWFGDRYFVFPQMNYSHLLQVKKTEWKEERKYRTRIDKKSADFVFCDKEQVVPQLVLELDGSSHELADRKRRDEFVNAITNVSGLPILHIKTSELNNLEDIRNRIATMLQ